MVHSNQFIIGNPSNGFQAKMQNLYNEITQFVGITDTMYYSKKFMLPNGFDLKN